MANSHHDEVYRDDVPDVPDVPPNPKHYSACARARTHTPARMTTCLQNIRYIRYIRYIYPSNPHHHDV